MSAMSNKDVVRSYVAAFNRGDIDTLLQIFAPDAVVQGVLGWGTLDVIVPIWRELHAALQIEMTIDEIIEEGNTVAARYTERGRFAAPFRGNEPTGKPYELVAMEWFTLRDGRITRRWGARDHASQMRQIGMPMS